MQNLAEQHPANFARWLLSDASEFADIQVLKTELSLEPIRADAVTFLQTASHILHLEFQTRSESNPPLPFRMLDYWVRLYRQYRCAITQIVLFLKPIESEAVNVEQFEAENTLHRYRVVRLWEQDPTPLLADPVLLPLAVLARTNSPLEFLGQVASRIDSIQEANQQRNISAYTQLLAGLRFEKDLIRQVFQRSFMRESVVYQEIFQEGRQEGRQEGERLLILRLLTRRFGDIPSDLQAQIQALSLPQLEELGEALLDFTIIADLEHWLQSSN